MEHIAHRPPLYNIPDAELKELPDFETNLPINEPDDSDNHKVIELRDGEVALDLWTFERDTKTRLWSINGVYRTGIFDLLQRNGFGKRYRSDKETIFLIRGSSIIELATDTLMRDHVRGYIEGNSGSLTVDYLSATYEGRLEIFNRQQHLTINTKCLEGLATHDRPFLRDTLTTSYIPYQNGIVQVTAQNVELLTYSVLEEHCIWKGQVLDRPFKIGISGENCHFARFLGNVSNNEPDRLRAMRSAIGYLIHHYGNPAEGQAIICYDEEVTDARKPEGGTGKGLFANGIRQIRPIAVIDGKKFDPNDRFCFQQVNQDTAVVWIDDPTVNHPRPERRFSLERFFSLMTEGWAVEKKHQHAFRIPAKEGPKLLISSNVVMPNDGSSNVRRQFIIEFGNYYKKQIQRGNEKPIQTEHKCIFFSDDWSIHEWQSFDNYMIGCVQDYLREGLQPYALLSADQNRLRQVAGEEFHEWVTTYDKTGLLADIEYNRDNLWRDYKVFAGLTDNVPLTRGFTNHISQYAKIKGWKFERGQDKRNPSFTLKAT